MVGLELDLEHDLCCYGCAQWEWLPSVAAEMLLRCCPAAVATGGVLRHVESDAGRSATTARCCLAVAGTMDAAEGARGAADWPSWERVFLKQQSPTQRKGGEAPGGLEGAVAELFFRPENAPLRGEACCPVPRRALLETRVGTNRRTTAPLLRALQLQGLPLRTSSTAPGLPLVNYSSVNAVAVRA